MTEPKRNKTICPCCNAEGKSLRLVSEDEIEESAIRVDEQGRLKRFCDHCLSQYMFTSF